MAFDPFELNVHSRYSWMAFDPFEFAQYNPLYGETTGNALMDSRSIFRNGYWYAHIAAPPRFPRMSCAFLPSQCFIRICFNLGSLLFADIL